jgi:hypothetical protein
MTLKELPLNSQTFTQIIDQNLLYADKTKYVYELVRLPNRSFFLSRPRRFGKTLLLHTLNELFTGNRDRFKGLWIERSDYGFQKRPVIFLSLSLRSDNPELLEANLLTTLKEIANENELEVEGASSDVCFGLLIRALYKRFESEVAVLIDEYDAPVARQMDNLEVAQANAKVLHDFFATLKNPMVSPFVHFTFVTGITRYALTSMDSGPNHLTDISLDPKYAGLCGFTLDEFDSLFADRMAPTLSEVKADKWLPRSAKLGDLRAEILHWYDGYEWGDETRVLNPYSILHFFQHNAFRDYWLKSGRPGHLTALIRKRPLDFLEPQLKSYLSAEFMKSDLTALEAVPVLFHSGYLTINKITKVRSKASNETKSSLKEKYSFRLPNFEVSSSYFEDCFSVIFNRETIPGFETMGDDLKKAFLSKDADEVSELFRISFKPIATSQSTASEKIFQNYIKLVLSAQDFDVRSEVSGADGRLDLSVLLPSQVSLVIELKHVSKPTKRPTDKENEILADIARNSFSIEEQDQSLARAARIGIGEALIRPIMKRASGAERTPLLAELAIEVFDKPRINKVLADLAMEKLSADVIDQALIDAVGGKSLSEEEIEGALTKAAKRALNQINEKKYGDLVKKGAKEIIKLGLAIYGNGSNVKALFG